MSTVAVGDIHGRADLLGPLLKRLRSELQPDDELVFLGDYVDRGPDVRSCFDLLADWRLDPPCPTVLLMGNHEECMLRSRDDHARHSWLTAMGGLTTIASYDPALERAFRDQLRTAGPRLYQERFPLPYDRFFAAMPDEHQEILDGLRFLHQTPDAVYVHAGFDADLSVEGQVADVVLWGAGFPRGYSGTQRVVYGHHSNAVRDGTRVLPRIADSTYGIDTVAAGVLTALRLPDGRLFQEPEPGATALAISLIRKTGSLVRGLSTRRWGRH